MTNELTKHGLDVILTTLAVLADGELERMRVAKLKLDMMNKNPVMDLIQRKTISNSLKRINDVVSILALLASEIDNMRSNKNIVDPNKPKGH